LRNKQFSWVNLGKTYCRKCGHETLQTRRAANQFEKIVLMLTVLDERETKAKREILVKWEGYDISSATSWEQSDAIPAHLI